MIFLGIDGGGSKTAFLLQDESGHNLAHVEAGPSNWLSAGQEQTRQSLADGIHRLPATPDVVSAGFAGAGRDEGIAFYRNCLQELLPQARVFIETDAFTTYVGAIGMRPGVLLIAGTGSIALARKDDSTMIRVGGWGPVFGDEGSGYWIGREAIATALRAHDAGVMPGFVGSIAEALSIAKITDAPAAWKSGSIDIRAVASLARLLLDQYPAEPGTRILREAAAHLRALVQLTRDRAGLPLMCTMSASGSLGTHPVLQKLIGVEFMSAAHSPAQGAILWARDRIVPS